ncbi:alcohol dehydrogenase catalytic domain-containing protein [Kineococcus sp. R8]|nr:alcohol dehydrogenase catalytic domain-containing protein [Kineococcus siccus]
MPTLTARAVVADGAGGLAVETVLVEPPGRGEVLVEVRASGVCHTDLDGLRRWCTRPTVLGHEGAGVVAAVGEGVQHVAPGDHVLLTWAIACGRCVPCSEGAPTLCEVLGGERGHAHPGSTRRPDGTPLDRWFNLGTMATATVVRAEAVVPIPADVPFPSACLLGCAVMTGFGSVVNAARVRAGSTVAVLGCGGVGLNVVQAARLAGARRVVAIDVDPARAEAARRFGATDVLRPERGDTSLRGLRADLERIGGGRLLDYAFECTGVPALAVAPLACIRNGGTAVQVSGTEERVTVDMTLFEWDKTYLNPLYGQCRPSVDFPVLVDLYRRGQLLLDELVSRTYPLEAAAEAFADAAAGTTSKGVLLP